MEIQSDILELVNEVDQDPVCGVNVHLHLLLCVPQKARLGEVKSMTLAMLPCFYSCDGDWFVRKMMVSTPVHWRANSEGVREGSKQESSGAAEPASHTSSWCVTSLPQPCSHWDKQRFEEKLLSTQFIGFPGGL